MEELGLQAAEPTGIPVGDISLDLVTELRHAVGTAFLDDEAILLDPATGVSHLLDATATLVVRCLDGRSTLDEIAADIADVLELDRAVVDADILSLVRTLGGNGLLEGVERDPHAGHQHAASPEGVAVGADLSGWSGWGALAGEAGPTLIVNWGTSCGFCTRISEELAELGPQMEAAGTRLVLVTPGSPEAVREQVGDLDLPVLHVEAAPELFFRTGHAGRLPGHRRPGRGRAARVGCRPGPGPVPLGPGPAGLSRPVVQRRPMLTVAAIFARSSQRDTEPSATTDAGRAETSIRYGEPGTS